MIKAMSARAHTSRISKPRHRWGLRLGLVVACAAVVLSLSGACASAALRYPSAPSSTFGSAGSGPGQLEGPNAVAVNDATGDVYVVDSGNGRVEWFDAAGGKLEGQFDGSGSFEVAGKTHSGTPAPTGKFSGPHSVAVDDSGKSLAEDPSVGDVYVVDAGHNVVDRFNAQGEYEGQITGSCETGPCTGEEAFSEIGGVAVSHSALLSRGLLRVLAHRPLPYVLLGRRPWGIGARARLQGRHLLPVLRRRERVQPGQPGRTAGPIRKFRDRCRSEPDF
jgi:hypothetical protein